MKTDIEKLLEAARHVRMTTDEKEQQRRSFAYGNTKIENELVTRETVAREAERLKMQHVEEQ